MRLMKADVRATMASSSSRLSSARMCGAVDERARHAGGPCRSEDAACGGHVVAAICLRACDDVFLRGTSAVYKLPQLDRSACNEWVGMVARVVHCCTDYT